MWKKLLKLTADVKASQSGATLVYFALALPVITGFAGLGFDATMWYMEKRVLQNVVDSSALAAAYSISKGDEATEVNMAAKYDASVNYFSVGGDNTMQVEYPPTSGKYAGQPNFVMVTTTTPAQGIFSSVLGVETGTIRTIATAGILAVGEHCILALDHTMDKALEFSGTSVVDINCGVASNSNASTSIYLNGTANLTANPSAQAYGDIYEGGSSSLNVPNPIQPFSQRSPDPYKDLTVPSDPAACTANNLTVKKNDPNPVPGRYCGGLAFGAQADVTLPPGEYIIDGGDLTVNGQAAIAGDGVTIFLTGDSPGDVGNVKINGGADITLSPPTTGDYTGVVMYQDRNAEDDGSSNDFLGGADMIMNGAVYFPSREIKYSGGSDDVSTCMQIIGNKVTFTGNAELYNDQSTCDLYGVEEIERTIVSLVE